jgi:hypothetical protein
MRRGIPGHKSCPGHIAKGGRMEIMTMQTFYSRKLQRALLRLLKGNFDSICGGVFIIQSCPQ